MPLIVLAAILFLVYHLVGEERRERVGLQALEAILWFFFLGVALEISWRI